ncbi:MAG: integrase, partial [Cyanobacteria bacterium P01_F01_bin.86]
MEFTERLNRANGRLKAAKIPCRVTQIGHRLYARGTFPPPPGSPKSSDYQQRIALKLPANPRGLELAEAKAKTIGIALESGTFAWADYREKAETVQEWVDKLCDQFEGADVTWKTDYQQPFNKLPAEAPLTTGLLLQTLESIKRERPNSRAQLRAYNAYRQLATLAGLPEDILNGLKGNYSANEVDPRDLPSDEHIAEWRSQIKDDGWRWLYGMLAAYGLRPHEAYKVDLADFPTVRVPPDTKTGVRFVWPLFPEWADQWKLADRT